MYQSTGERNHLISRLKGKRDVIVRDSPPLPTQALACSSVYRRVRCCMKTGELCRVCCRSTLEALSRAQHRAAQQDSGKGQGSCCY